MAVFCSLGVPRNSRPLSNLKRLLNRVTVRNNNMLGRPSKYVKMTEAFLERFWIFVFAFFLILNGLKCFYVVFFTVGLINSK